LERCSQLFAPIFAGRADELMLAALLDPQCMLIELIGIPGTREEVRIKAGEILRQAVLAEAAGILLAHNHPSGDNCPSRSDKVFTRQFALQCEALDLAFVDHLLFDHQPVYSMRRHGWL
jgi:DNA repair protein RadC